MKISELIPTLTGFEELGIEQVCGKPLEEIVDSGTDEHPKASRDILLARVMGAVLLAREDKTPLRVAWDKVQAMTQAQLGDLFEDDEDDQEEVFEDEPVTDSGKGDSEPGSEPLSSPPSSSTPV